MIKQLTKKKAAVVPASKGQEAPAKTVAKPSEFMKKLKSKMPTNKTMLDIGLFAVTVFIVYEYGKDIAKFVEDCVPTEQGMLEQMK